ncbi:MAG: hypothetical protein JO123_10800 [Ktedonobacteraceae bacterium]|nr:hypothetical protein [Ktedonobacteraceae bacterium]
MPFAFTVEHMVSLGRIPFVGSFAVPTARDKMVVQDAMYSTDVSAFAQRVFNELSGG